MNQLSDKKDKNIESIIKYYQSLLKENDKSISTLKDVRDIYDRLITPTLEKENLPDGELFRKDIVYINDGIKNIHQGFYPEIKIKEGMNDFIKLYNSNKETYLKCILSHFILESIHPFYDGNGRLGRYLFSSLLFHENKTYFSFLIAKSINEDKSKYYSALKEGRDIHEFGCVNNYVSMMLDIFLSEIENNILKLKEKKKQIDNLSVDNTYTKTEKKVYLLLKEASILSDYGINNEEIIEECKISKRALIYALNKFREQDILLTTTFGRYSYHKIR